MRGTATVQTFTEWDTSDTISAPSQAVPGRFSVFFGTNRVFSEDFARLFALVSTSVPLLARHQRAEVREVEQH